MTGSVRNNTGDVCDDLKWDIVPIIASHFGSMMNWRNCLRIFRRWHLLAKRVKMEVVCNWHVYRIGIKLQKCQQL